METPRSTIVIVPREITSVTAAHLEAIAQRAGSATRVIVLDGGSRPRYRREIDDAAERLDALVLRAPHHLAPSEARAAALSFVDTELVVFVDNDASLSEGWLAVLEQCADRTGAWIVGPLHLHGYPTGSPEEPRIHMTAARCRIVDVDARRPRFEMAMLDYDRPAAAAWPAEPIPTEMIEFHCLLARTEILRAPGMHEPELLTDHCIFDIGLETRKRGGELWIDPGAWVYYDRPRRLHRGDRSFFTLRWSDAWDRHSGDAFCAKWALDPECPELAELYRWNRYHRCRDYLPARTLTGRAARRLRHALDAPTQRWTVRRDARLRRRGALRVVRRPAWVTAAMPAGQPPEAMADHPGASPDRGPSG